MDLTLTEKFVRNFYLEKERFSKEVLSKDSKTFVAQKIKELNLSESQSDKLNVAISQLLTDVFYTILLGLDGSASIGDNMQEVYKIYDEEENLISDCGEIEAEAYEYFYNHKIDDKEI